MIWLVLCRILWQAARLKSYYWGQDFIYFRNSGNYSFLSLLPSELLLLLLLYGRQVSFKNSVLKSCYSFFIWKDVAASADTHCLFDCCKFFYLSILLDTHAAWPPVSPPPQSFADVNSGKQKYWSEITVFRLFHSIHEISKIWLPSKGWKVFVYFCCCCLMINLFFPSVL